MLNPRTRLSGPASSPSSAGGGAGRNVLIHVFDEYRKSAKDFVCDRALLLAKMKYFQAYLNQSNEHDEIDISVHCDVEIFEWLVQYMQQSEAEWKPRIALENIASILVSSEFLQMEALVDECVRFITTRMQQFLQLRVDFSCLSDATIAKIADCCSAEELQVLHDPKDKILSKLQRKKLEAYVKRLQEAGRDIERCENCESIYLKENLRVLSCPNGRHQIGVHGELVAHHQPKADWKVEEFLRDLTSEKHATWSAVYWYAWASTNCFFCGTCKHHFPFLELHQCAFHPGQVVGSGSDAKFSCCSVRLFDSNDLAVSGCNRKEHVAIFVGSEQDVVAEKSLEAVTKIPMLWDLIRSCDKVARSAPTANMSEATTGFASPSVQIFALQELLHGEQPPTVSVAKRPATAAAAASSSSSSTAAVGGSGDPNSSHRRRQWRALQLQEKDRVRHQLLARRLVQMRKNLTT
ncbi:hypothetical protein Gpo141_00002027 [Globisporangium polare]